MKRKIVFVLSIIFAVILFGCLGFAEEDEQVSILVNNGEVVFSREPIVKENDIVLVSLEDFGKAMNANIVWDGQGKSFAIGFKNIAFMANTLETEAIIAENYDYGTWKTVQLHIPSFYLVSEGLIFIPLQDVCMALGMQVSYDKIFQELHITYDRNEGNTMTAEMLRYMDMVYYANHNDKNYFDIASEDFFEFLDQRVEWIDGTAMGLSDIWAGIQETLSGMTNAESVMKESLEIILGSLPDNDIVTVDSEILSFVKGAMDSGVSVFDDTMGIGGELVEIVPQLTPLSDPGSNYGDISLMYDIADYSVDMLAILLSNYKMNISYLDTLETVLSESGCLDENTAKIIAVLKTEYTNKFFQMLEKTRDEMTKFSISQIADIGTGGIFSVGNFTWDLISQLSGLKDKGQALKIFYGLYCMNMPLDTAYKNQYQKILNGNPNVDDLEKLKQLDDLQRALKMIGYQCIEMVTDHEDTQKYCAAEAEKYSESCLRWTESLVTAADTMLSDQNLANNSVGDISPGEAERKVYETVLDEYRTLMEHDFYKDASNGEIPYHSSDIAPDSHLNINLINDGRLYSENCSVYYALEDVNGDGSCELYIGAKRDDDTEVKLYDVLTNNGSEVLYPFTDMISDFGYRSNLNVYANGIYEVVWSGGAWYNGSDYYRIAEDGERMEMGDRLVIMFLQEDDWAAHYYRGKEEVEISEQEYNRLVEHYANLQRQEIDWKLLQPETSSDMPEREETETQVISGNGNSGSSIINAVCDAKGLEYIGNNVYDLRVYWSEIGNPGIDSISTSGIISAVEMDIDYDGSDEVFAVSFEPSGRIGAEKRTLRFSVLKNIDGWLETVAQTEIISSTSLEFNGTDTDASSLYDASPTLYDGSVFIREYNGEYQFFFEKIEYGVFIEGVAWELKGYQFDGSDFISMSETASLHYAGSFFDALWSYSTGELRDYFGSETAAIVQEYRALGFTSDEITYNNLTAAQNPGTYQIVELVRNHNLSYEAIDEWENDPFLPLDGYWFSIRDCSENAIAHSDSSYEKETVDDMVSIGGENGEYIFYDSSSRYLDESDIQGYSVEEIQRAVNEIYARHGRTFSRPENDEYFRSKSWYHPDPGKSDEQIVSEFNEYEAYNVSFMSRYL